MTPSSASNSPDIGIGNTPAIHLEAASTADTDLKQSPEALAEETTTLVAAAMDSQTEQQVNTEMLSPPPQTVTVTIPTPSQAQVFAPRPIRAPFPVLYRPIPQRLPKGLAVQLEESPLARSPSPVTTVQHRRSSSAASTLGDIPARWNSMNLKMLESKLPAAETSEAEEREGSTGENNNLLQLYRSVGDVVLVMIPS